MPPTALIVMPPFLDYEVIRARADAFLRRYGWSGELPVNIERIIDVEMGINIVREPNLSKRIDVEGFLSRDRSTIYVDDYTHDVLENRYRFTLAHEAGHHDLHAPLYRAATFDNPEGWMEFQAGFPERVKARYEYQANCFAGLVLAPAQQMRLAVDEAMYRARGRWYEIDLNDEADRSYIVPEVARRLGVSGEVVDRRARFDGLWK